MSSARCQVLTYLVGAESAGRKDQSKHKYCSVYSKMERFWSFLLGPLFPPSAAGSRKRSALARTCSSFLIPSSLIPGKGTARRKLPFHPTHSCWKEALAGAKLSQKRESRRSRSLFPAPCLGSPTSG